LASEWDELRNHLEGNPWDEDFEKNWNLILYMNAALKNSFSRYDQEEQARIKEYVHQFWLDNDRQPFMIRVPEDDTDDEGVTIPGWET